MLFIYMIIYVFILINLSSYYIMYMFKCFIHIMHITKYRKGLSFSDYEMIVEIIFSCHNSDSSGMKRDRPSDNK